jgi:ribonuclease Z
VTPLVQAQLINDPFGDAGLYLDFRFGRRAILFDLGDLHALAPRQLSRVGHAFVSHAHMDHFSGFDRLLAVCLSRRPRLDLFGPPGLIERVEHKLAAYSWNLVAQNAADFVVGVAEFHEDRLGAAAEFHTRDSFRRRVVAVPQADPGVLLDEAEFRVRAATLDHSIPCLGFAFEEKFHINVWKSRLTRLGLPVGPWLNDLKAAVRRGAPDETPFTVVWTAAGTRQETTVALGTIKAEALRIARGQKLAYVVDAVYHTENAARIVALADGADIFFIESVFLDQDGALATQKFHLTAAQAGSLAREARAVHVEPFHFSPRYVGREAEIRREVNEAFIGVHPAMAAGAPAARH